MNARGHQLSVFSVLPALLAACTLAGCEWIAGIERTTVGADAGHTTGDAAPVEDAPLGPGDGGGKADAAVPAGCPAPCLFDAVAEFAYEELATNDVWVYVEEAPSPLGTSYSEMHIETRDDGILAYVGNGPGSPAIVHCPSYPGYVHCAGVEDKILFETTAPGANQPALAWMAPPMGRSRYRLSGDLRVPSNALTDAPMTVLLVRNSRFDTMVEKQFLTSTEPTAFDVELDLQPSDILRLIVIPGDATPVPVALSFHVSEARSPGRCEVTTFFEEVNGGTPDFSNLCASSLFVDGTEAGQACPDPSPECPPTTELLPPAGVRGRSRVFVEGASIEYQGPPNDYTGDFTVQFWAYLDSAGSWTNETLLADHDCATEGGISVRRRRLDPASSEVSFEAYYDDPAVADRCTIGPSRSETLVSNDTWHFFRLTRSTATETMSMCIDGAYRGSAPVPGDADMSATEPMWLGRAVTYEPAYFRGRLAELRVLGEALPCSAP